MYSICLWSFFIVAYSSLSPLLMPSKDSTFGIELKIGCFLKGAGTLAGFSTAASAMLRERPTREMSEALGRGSVTL